MPKSFTIIFVLALSIFFTSVLYVLNFFAIILLLSLFVFSLLAVFLAEFFATMLSRAYTFEILYFFISMLSLFPSYININDLFFNFYIINLNKKYLN